MVILVLSEDTTQGAAVANEITALLESLKIGVNRGDDCLLLTEEVQTTALEALQGGDIDLICRRLRAKTT